MKKKEKIKITSLFLLFALIMSGCAARYRPSNEKMIPTITRNSYISNGKILKLEVGEEIEAKKPQFLSLYKIDPNDFEDALRETLIDSGIFKQVVADQKADYQLNFEIISQEVPSGFTMRTTLFVYYNLIETTTNQVVWEESLVSHHVVEFKEAFDGAVRAKLANEGAVRDNLTQLLNKLSHFFSQLNKNETPSNSVN